MAITSARNIAAVADLFARNHMPCKASRGARMAPAAMRELMQGLEMEAAAWIYASDYLLQRAGAWDLCQKW